MAYARSPHLFPMDGGCGCGLIRFRLALPPLLVHCCHCTLCQRQLGSAFAINALVESSAITLLPPAPPPPEPGLAPLMARLTAARPARPDAPLDAPGPVLVTVPSPSGLGQTMAQCPACHLPLWSFYGDFGPHLTYLRASTLDRASDIDPDVHIFTRSRRRFFAITDDKPQYDAYYPSRTPFYRPDCAQRLAALEAKQQQWKADLAASISASPPATSPTSA